MALEDSLFKLALLFETIRKDPRYPKNPGRRRPTRNVIVRRGKKAAKIIQNYFGEYNVFWEPGPDFIGTRKSKPAAVRLAERTLAKYPGGPE